MIPRRNLPRPAATEARQPARLCRSAFHINQPATRHEGDALPGQKIAYACVAQGMTTAPGGHEAAQQ